MHPFSKGNRMEYISIGRIVNTHGIKGELKVESWSDFDEERYEKGNRVYIYHDGKYIPFTVSSFRFHKNHTLVTLSEIHDINEAEIYKNDEICIDSNDRGELPEGEYYQDDLIGMKAVSEDGEELGTITDVEETFGTQNHLRIAGKTKDILVPYVPAFVKDVDEKEGIVTIHVMEGLL